MARPRKDAELDLSVPHELTAGLIERLTCRTDTKAQAFLRDTKSPSLRVRVTNTGAKSFVFEAKLNRQTIRRTIGNVSEWSIEDARKKANALRNLLDNGTDPRELERQQQAEQAAQKARAAAFAITAGEVWTAYMEARKPFWSDRHYLDHAAKVQPGGKQTKRGTRGRGVTIAGPLHALMGKRLADLDTATIEAWAAKEAKTRPTAARLAWRLLKAFLTWCSEQPEYAPIMAASNPAKTKKTREVLGKAKEKKDALMREQLPAWFTAVRNISNPTIAAYLQTVLLTGARPGEVLALRWEDVDSKWNSLTMRDKVEGDRMIPLTPYVAELLATLPRRVTVDKKTGEKKANPWVFSSDTADAGALTIPRSPHVCACKVAGIEGLTLHGLRRSFKSLTEWLEIPAGVVAQIMGHKPSATAEKHYTVRPLDLLRLHHERIEAWILEQGGVPFVRKAEPGKLTLVA